MSLAANDFAQNSKLRTELNNCFNEFNQKKTHREMFAKKILDVLIQHTQETALDASIVYESVSLCDKTSLSFIQSLIGGLAMTKREGLALNVMEKVAHAFPELIFERVIVSKTSH